MGDLAVKRYHSLKRQNTAGVCLRVREGIDSLSKYSHAQFLYLLSINLNINPLLMGQLWVSASHLQDANQGPKLRDQPLRQSCSSASEWLLKHGDACIDFSSSLKERRGWGCIALVGACVDRGCLCVWTGAIPWSPVTLHWSGGLTEWPSREALNLQTRRGQGAGCSGGSGLVGATSAEISVIEKGFNLNVGAKTLLEAK